MNYVENPIYGRKVFFLNPPLSVENAVSGALKDREYEIYIIREYALAKPVLRKFPNAICWIYIDDELSYEAWCNFIKSFEYDAELKSIFIGVLTKRAKPKDQEFFMINTQLPGGFVRLDQAIEDTTKQLMGILDLNGAKGTRKCLRLELEAKNDVIAYFSTNSNIFSFQLKDISPVGFSANTPAKLISVFKKDTFIHNVSITLGRYSFTCTIQIFHAALSGNSCLILATFSDDTDKEIRRKIHDYIYQNLEIRYKTLTSELQMDPTNYNIAPTVNNPDDNKKEDEKTEGQKDTANDQTKNDAKTEDQTKTEDDEEAEPVEELDEEDNSSTQEEKKD